MKLRTKLLAIVLFVGLLPLSVSAWVILGIHQRSQARAVADLHGAMAIRQAERVSYRLTSVARQLERLVQQSIQWSSLSLEEQQAALWLLYGQDEDIVVASLVSRGNLVSGESAYVTEENIAEAPGHLAGSLQLARELLQHIPAAHPNPNKAVFGKAFLPNRSRFPVLPMVFAVPRAQSSDDLRVVIALSLRNLCVTQGRTASGVTLALLDSHLRWACPSASTAALSPVDATLREALRTSGTRAYTPEGSAPQLLTQAETGSGFRVLATQPLREADAAGSKIRNHALLWIAISIAISVTSGWLLSRGILAPVARLVRGARELAGGNLGYRLDMPEKDELGLLGQAFNDMATELEARENQIRGWNEELQERVRERTRAIELYHQRLVYMEKAGVTASLSAGVATEINDPLTGVLGVLQLLVTRMRQDPAHEQEVRLLSNAETGAQQIRKLVKRMQDLSQRQPRCQLRPVRVRDLVSGALNEVAHDLKENGIEVVQQFPSDVPPVLGNFTQLEQALVQVLNNAVTACWRARHGAAGAVPSKSRRMPEPRQAITSGQAGGAPGEPGLGLDSPQPRRANGRIVILVQPQPQPHNMVEISVSDNGIGIKDEDLSRIFEPFVAIGEPRGTGLGLTVARHIVEEHGGSLSATSDHESGATFRIRLPQAEGL